MKSIETKHDKNNWDVDADVDAIEQIIEIQEQSKLSTWTIKDYQQELEKEHSLIFVAKTNRRVIGFLTSRLLKKNPFEDVRKNETAVYSEAEILNFGVSETYRRRGIGSLLFDEFLKKTVDLAIETIWLEVRISNAGAINFYTHKGFIRTRQRKNFYSLPIEDAVEMRRAAALAQGKYRKAAKLDSVIDFEITLLSNPE